MTHINHARTDAEEQDSIFLVEGVELGRDHIDGCLRCRIEGSHFELVLVDKICVPHTAGDDSHFLAMAFEDLWHEYVDEMNVAEDVGVHDTAELLGELIGISTSIIPDISIVIG